MYYPQRKHTVISLKITFHQVFRIEQIIFEVGGKQQLCDLEDRASSGWCSLLGQVS